MAKMQKGKAADASIGSFPLLAAQQALISAQTHIAFHPSGQATQHAFARKPQSKSMEALFLDTRCIADRVTQIIQLGATDKTLTDNRDFRDSR